MKRRQFIKGSLAATAAAAAPAEAQDVGTFKLATFETEVTIPIGHACMGGGISPAKQVVDPLFARGFVLSGGGKPVVVVSVEWCEIRNAAFDSWRRALADAAGTEPARVLISSTHAHDAPVMDYAAEEYLRSVKSAGSVCDPEFGESAVRNVAAALTASLRASVPVSHYGIGRAKVEGVGSNRRFVLPDGGISYARGSRCTDPVAKAAAEGDIDPWLKTLSFWSGDKLIAALHAYATHPMSYYGGGEVSADFPGAALALMRQERPDARHIYASGCSGNVTVGKYNDGSRENRAVLAARLHRGMSEALGNTQRQPLKDADFRSVPLVLQPRKTIGFSREALLHRLKNEPKPFGQCLAAMGLSWLDRTEKGIPIDVPALDFGGARLLLLPAESYVEFQLHAQEVCGEVPVVVLGYGECAPGYIPIERAWRERDSNLGDWCWVNPGAEEPMKAAIREALAF